MAQTIAHRELRNRSSEILREVQAGETFEITNHGVVIAALTPAPRGHVEPLRIRKASRKLDFSTLPRKQAQESVQSVLDDLRGNR